MRTFLTVIAAGCLLLGFSSGDAKAQKSPPAEQGGSPWNSGVTEEQKAKAKPFFDAGNDYFERSMYSKALIEYRKALEFRDHPAIRYNVAVCLINLRLPIEAHENLVVAMQYGEAPLAEGLFKEGKTYMSLLEGQLGKVVIKTKEAGARVSLDGKELFVGPGEATLMTKPETHQITTVKKGMLTDNREFVPRTGDAVNVFEITMVPFSSAGIVHKRRWSRWKPWAVVGGGLGIAAIGVPLYFFARQNMTEYDSRFSSDCPMGCNADAVPAATADFETRAKLQNTSAVSLFIAGGVAATSGALLLYLNRPRAFRVKEVQTEQGTAGNFHIVPTFEGGAVGAVSSYSIAF